MMRKAGSGGKGREGGEGGRGGRAPDPPPSQSGSGVRKRENRERGIAGGGTGGAVVADAQTVGGRRDGSLTAQHLSRCSEAEKKSRRSSQLQEEAAARAAAASAGPAPRIPGQKPGLTAEVAHLYASLVSRRPGIRLQYPPPPPLAPLFRHRYQQPPCKPQQSFRA